jgi:RHS repeat-associated protein
LKDFLDSHNRSIPVKKNLVFHWKRGGRKFFFQSFFFELVNHLQNVLVTVSDKKTPVDDGTYTYSTVTGYTKVNSTPDGKVDYHTPDIITANDYYPYGMMMPGRKYAANTTTAKYRFSINGQEKETELNENITTAMYWEYDSRIGRRWNTDPKPTTDLSPYACFFNNPIIHIDALGDSGQPVSSKYWYSGYIPKFKTNGTLSSNPIQNGVNAIGNGIIDVLNIFPAIWNSGVMHVEAANEGRYFSTTVTAAKNTYNDLSRAVDNTITYTLNTPLKQQLKDAVNGWNDPHFLETVVSSTVTLSLSSNLIFKGNSLGTSSVVSEESTYGSMQVGKPMATSEITSIYGGTGNSLFNFNRNGKITGGAAFASLKDHAKRHFDFGGANPNAYYNSAVKHTTSAQIAIKVTHNRTTKMVFITPLENNSYMFTSTSLSGKRIFTHMKVDLNVTPNYFKNSGITLPKNGK